MQEQNFADEIYKLFKSKRRTALRCNDLIEAYKKQYNRQLNTTELRELPFIQFERNAGNNNMIYLVVELDDCCNKCKFRYCKLLHSVDQNDKFILLYQHASDKKDNESKSNDSASKDNSHKSKKTYRYIERPNIRLIQRVKDILNESTSNPKQVTLKNMKKRHNHKFPQFKSHEPTSHGIAIRFKSTFHIGYDEQNSDHLITFKHDQNHQNLTSQYKNQSRYNRDSRNGGYHSINLNKSHSSSKYKKSNVILNSKKSHQSPWQKKSKPKPAQTPTNDHKHTQSANNSTPSNPKQPTPATTTTTAPDTQLTASSNAKATKLDDAIECKEHRANTDTPTPPQTASNPAAVTAAAQIIPEQPNKHYLSIGISPEWNDSKLIPDLVRHISQHTGKHIGDAYISNRIRLGFFTAKTPAVANQFIKNTRDHRVKCWGRTVVADIIPLPNNSHHGSLQRQQNGYRVKIQNVNCIMGRRDFENWVYKTTNTLRRRHMIYDIEIVFPKIQRGSHQCIMLFDKAEDTKYVVDKIQNVQFRGLPLVFKYWRHPNYQPQKSQKQHPKQKQSQSQNQSPKKPGKKAKKQGKNSKKSQSSSHTQSPSKLIVHKNKIKKTASSSKPQTSIWAKMATQRKQAKLQKQKRKDMKPSMEKPIHVHDDGHPKPGLAKQLSANNDTASTKSTKSSKSAKSSSPAKPLQPTKPPKHLSNNVMITPNVANLEHNTPVTPPPQIEAHLHSHSSPTLTPDVGVAGNNKPRVPPLINSINRFRNDNNSLSPTVEHCTQTAQSLPLQENTEPVQEKHEEAPQSEESVPVQPGEAEQGPVQREGEEAEDLNEQKEDAMDTPPQAENANDTPPQVQAPPPKSIPSQPQSQPLSAAASQPMALPSNNVNLISNANVSFLAAQRQFNQLSTTGQLQMNPMYIQQIQQLQAQQLQQQQQIGQPIRIVPINHLQQIQQLQQLQAQQMNMNPFPNININNINNINGINTLPNIYHPSYQLQNLPNISMPSYISSIPNMPPPPSSFNNIQFTPTGNTPQQNNNSNNASFAPSVAPPAAAQKATSRMNAYQSPPRHQNQSFLNNNNRNHVNKNNNNRTPPSPNTNTNANVDNSSSTQSNEKNETNQPPKQTNPWDRLCKFCLLAEHEPSKCIWFNPNSHK